MILSIACLAAWRSTRNYSSGWPLRRGANDRTCRSLVLRGVQRQIVLCCAVCRGKPGFTSPAARRRRARVHNDGRPRRVGTASSSVCASAMLRSLRRRPSGPLCLDGSSDAPPRQPGTAEAAWLLVAGVAIEGCWPPAAAGGTMVPAPMLPIIPWSCAAMHAGAKWPACCCCCCIGECAGTRAGADDRRCGGAPTSSCSSDFPTQSPAYT